MGVALVYFLAFAVGAQTKVDFVKDIQPVFPKSCLQCHGAEKQKGDLRLDTKEVAMKGGKDGVVIVAGQADKSDLYRRVSLPEGSDDIMPNKGDPLTKAQTDLIKDWINQGAVWPEGVVAKAEEPAPVSPYAELTVFKPASAEAGAVAKLEAAGVTARPVAMNLVWREANFRSLGTNATDATIAPVKDILTLVDLNLGGTKISDAGLQAVAGLTNLVTLHLEHTGVTDAGLAHLKKLKHLAYLNLFDTKVTDHGLEQLKELAGLKRVYLWETKVTTNGTASLQAALPKVMISRGWENEPGAKKEESKKEEPKKDEPKKDEPKKEEKKEEKKDDNKAPEKAPEKKDAKN